MKNEFENMTNKLWNQMVEYHIENKLEYQIKELLWDFVWRSRVSKSQVLIHITRQLINSIGETK